MGEEDKKSGSKTVPLIESTNPFRDSQRGSANPEKISKPSVPITPPIPKKPPAR